MCFAFLKEKGRFLEEKKKKERGQNRYKIKCFLTHVSPPKFSTEKRLIKSYD